MARTAAQKAARRARRSNAEMRSLTKPAMSPALVADIVRMTGGRKGKGKKKKKQRPRRDRAANVQIRGGGAVARPAVIEFSELVTDLSNITIGGFELLSLNTAGHNPGLIINPGMSSTFPQTSAIARDYEKYRFRKLVFHYEKLVTGYSTLGQTGQILYNVDFDINDPAPTSASAFQNAKPNAYGMPCGSFSLEIPPHLLSGVGNEYKYVRRSAAGTGSGLGGADPKFYDAALLFIAADSLNASGKFGRLRISGIVEFIDMVQNLPSVGTTPNYTVTLFGNSILQTFNSSVGAQVSVIVPAAGYIDGLGVSVTPSGQIILPAGNYRLSFKANLSLSTSIANGFSSITLSTLKTGLNIDQVVPFACAGIGIPNTLSTITIASEVYVSSAGLDYVTYVVSQTNLLGVSAILDSLYVMVQGV